MPEAPLGILGGTFDPVHRAHLHLARAALKKLDLAEVLWVPAGLPSHREAPHASAPHRLEMVRLATAGEPGFAVDAADASAGQPSYTVPTLERLRASHGATRPLVLLMGADAFLGLPSWLRWREIFALAHVAVAWRPGADLAAGNMQPQLADLFSQRWRDDGRALAVAPAGAIVGFATAVRALLRAGGALPPDLLPATVLDYIHRNHLYSA